MQDIKFYKPQDLVLKVNQSFLNEQKRYIKNKSIKNLFRKKLF